MYRMPQKYLHEENPMNEPLSRLYILCCCGELGGEHNSLIRYTQNRRYQHSRNFPENNPDYTDKDIAQGYREYHTNFLFVTKLLTNVF